MSPKIFNLGSRGVYADAAHSAIVVLPVPWLVEHGLSIGDTLYAVVGMTEVRVYHEGGGIESISKALKVRPYKQGKKTVAAMTVTAEMRSMLDISIGDKVGFWTETRTGVLHIGRGVGDGQDA